jgi:hypothetical protein
VDEVKKITEMAKAYMLRNGCHVPMIFTKGTNGKVFTLLESFGNTADERVKDMLYAGAMVADQRNVGELELIVFVSEAWMGSNRDVMPSQDPQRIEVLLINTLDTQTQEEQIIAFEIVRDNQEKVIDLRQMGLPEKDSVKGMLLPAFQKGYQMISPVTN